MNTLAYLSYGRRLDLDELVYSVLTALHVAGGEKGDYRIVIYTDGRNGLGDLPVHIEPLISESLIDWAGPYNFKHRRKIFVIRDALEKFGGRLLYCDSDTFFLKHPNALFSRILPGHTLMHVCEGHLNDSNGAGLAEFLDKSVLRTVSGRRWNITADALMFNAGVIGIHEADIRLLEEVVHLTDQIYPHVRIHTIEQFAFSACLKQHTKLQESYDVVCHYWPMPGRALFREQIREIVHDPSITSYKEVLYRLAPHRPVQTINRFSESLRDRIRSALRRVAKRARILNQVRWAVHALRESVAACGSFIVAFFMNSW